MGKKQEVRKLIWSELEEKDIARFPRPVKGRIPNFDGAEAAGERLEDIPVFGKAKRVKVNPDSPQKPVRRKVIENGKTLIMPTPRLKQGFLRINPSNVPAGKEQKATTIKHSKKFGELVDLEDLPNIDLVVAGSVAVSGDGGRVGKGGGYSDLEYAILRELNLGNPPILTTVHQAQIIDELPHEKHDIPIDWIVTPEDIIETNTDYKKPTRINWELLDRENLEKIPILRKLREKTNLSLSDF